MKCNIYLGCNLLDVLFAKACNVYKIRTEYICIGEFVLIATQLEPFFATYLFTDPILEIIKNNQRLKKSLA